MEKFGFFNWLYNCFYRLGVRSVSIIYFISPVYIILKQSGILMRKRIKKKHCDYIITKAFSCLKLYTLIKEIKIFSKTKETLHRFKIGFCFVCLDRFSRQNPWLKLGCLGSPEMFFLCRRNNEALNGWLHCSLWREQRQS